VKEEKLAEPWRIRRQSTSSSKQQTGLEVEKKITADAEDLHARPAKMKLAGEMK
jgi:hypothetical protein